MLHSVWCCIRWLFVKKGLGQRAGVAATALLCADVQMLLCWLPWLLSLPVATLLTRLQLGGRKSGFGHRKFSKHSLSTASGQAAGRVVDKGCHLCPKFWSTRC